LSEAINRRLVRTNPKIQLAVHSPFGETGTDFLARLDQGLMLDFLKFPTAAGIASQILKIILQLRSLDFPCPGKHPADAIQENKKKGPLAEPFRNSVCLSLGGFGA
jgi:hypothetical protein